MNLWRVEDGGKLVLDLHVGQTPAWECTRRIIAILAGTQGGKTSFLPWWLMREIQRCGSGDYLAVTDSFDLFKLKFLPAMRECFEHVLGWGRYWSGERILELADPATGRFLARRADDPMWARIILRSAAGTAGVESATAKAAVLDEAGLEHYTLETFEAIMRRLSLSMGRLLLATTLYTLNWVKTHILNPWRAGRPDLAVFQFDSDTNPAFPKAEFERARAAMPAWRFDMRYRGRDTHPAGMIYDCFDRALHTCPRFPIPTWWPRYGGLDFGGVHTAALLLAEDPQSGRLYAYREYLAGSRTAAEHVTALLRRDKPMVQQEPQPRQMVGGSKSEGQWRWEWAAAGLPVEAPDVPEVEVQITRTYGALKLGGLIFFDDLEGVLGQLESYSRVLDAESEPTEEIADKATFHWLDALRYLISRIRPGAPPQDYGPQESFFA